ncbi:MAG TPA: DNA-3-methyladenine glycosylase [Candidatus Limnocylindrales bacterium]|nr:DNA-3-methyladenine glycosylase [Candidatus Limnocylindrales bacterium]
MSDLRELLGRPTLEAARGLLGARLIREGPTGGQEPIERREGRIVELEAYIGEDDRASHARFGRTARNAVMYGPPGVAYVYLVYGMYDCLNIVTEPAGRPAALLVRAVEPLAGVDAMRAARLERWATRRRSAEDAARAAEAARLAALPDARVASGPGLVAAAFDLDRNLTGLDLLDPAAAVRLEARPGGEPAPRMTAGPRVGIAYAGSPWTEMPWRLWITGHASVSGPSRGEAGSMPGTRGRGRPGGG